MLQFTEYIIHTEKGGAKYATPKICHLGILFWINDYISADARRNTYSALLLFESRR